MKTGMTIIETKNLTKTYRRFIKPEGLKESFLSLWKREYEEKTAVKELDFSMEEGEIVGLIGPNGAGKTTLTKMLTGIIAPTAGSIQVLGYYPNDLKNEFKQQYAVVMGQKSQLFRHALSVYPEQLPYRASLQVMFRYEPKQLFSSCRPILQHLLQKIRSDLLQHPEMRADL